jgi:hypothetical protein
MSTTLRPRIIQLSGFLISLLMASLVWAQDYSHVRIVRLSFVEGTVTVQRPDVAEWASAPVNTPIQEGFKLSTAESSFAEVEFENASTARLGELSLLEFTQLALSPAGDKVNRLTLHQGYATFNVIPEHDDVYEVKAADATVIPYGKAMFRVDLESGLTRVAVLKGSVDVSSPYGSGTVAKDFVLVIRPEAEQPFQVSQGITKDDWDAWVEQRENAGTTLRNKASPGFYAADAGSVLYGWNDLWNYGNWSYLPGYGYGWTPIVPAGWMPFGFGSWCWYPGFGYTWISGDPWGWLPFHYGQWVLVPGAGWCWLPGGGFGMWSPAPVVWYQGPGWVGWAPASSSTRVPAGGQSACQNNPKACTTAVSVNTFQNGKPVGPTSLIGVDVLQGRLVPTPNIPPTRLAMLPGAPFLPGSTKSGIAFDPASGSFVNSHKAGAASLITSIPASSAPGSTSSAATTPANPVAAAESSSSARPRVSPAQAGTVSRPAPAEPPVMRAHGAARAADSWGSSASGHPSGNSPSFEHSARSSSGRSGGDSSSHAASTSSHESSSSIRGGGDFSGGGTASGGASSGGHGGGGTSSGGHSSSGSHH